MQLATLHNTFLMEWNKSATEFIGKASLPSEMHQTLNLLCSTSESNPRRLKRVLNVVLIAFEVAKSKLEHEDDLMEKVIASNPLWPEFSTRLTKWIFLCELYPFRMSFLVQMLMDLEQKKMFNRNLFASMKQHVKGPTNSNQRNVKDKIKTPLVYYVDIDAIDASADVRTNPVTGENTERFDEASLALLDTDGMNIGEFFFLYVEKYLYTIASSEKLLRLDGDPELFATLLYSSIQLDQDRNISIHCMDILGPLKNELSNDDTGIASSASSSSSGPVLLSDTVFRDKNFALMTYSFNLNPSMSKQIGMELRG
jgi:hypothetical protein